jgi:hypothetical protein
MSNVEGGGRAEISEEDSGAGMDNVGRLNVLVTDPSLVHVLQNRS